MVTTKKGLGADLATIEQIPTADLIPYARNSRTHSDEQIAQIAASIREFGFCNPVLIDAQNTIIAGHGRVLAAGRLKLETVPCLRLTHLTDAQRRAYVIVDNRIALSSSWDSELLANELSDLHADDFDMGLLGFDADELSTLMEFEQGQIVEAEAGIDRTTQEYLDGNEKQFQFFVSQEDFPRITEAISVAKKQSGTETNSEAIVWKLLN
jgi:ParB-like chromosome segregation protein Spo0J